MASVGKKQRPILRLLPSVCRDCGRSEEAEPLSDYLDFRLCGACVARRERELMRGPAAEREADVSKPSGERAGAAGAERRKERGPKQAAPKGKTGRKPAPAGGKGSRGKKKR